ncbi:MAG: hypothetical protein JW891_16525 [Candidatus Lokiarchaeota archaeon]|nr:hypothetical protein [Candidatus Lokiarchaeota archaeon]
MLGVRVVKRFCHWSARLRLRVGVSREHRLDALRGVARGLLERHLLTILKSR